MTIYEKIINKLQHDDRVCAFVQMLTGAVATWLEAFDTKISETMSNFFFDSLTLDGILYFENLLKITPSDSQTLDDRRYAIQAKWLMNNHNSIALIQRVCNSWKNGEIEADFVNGKIRITFVGSYGIPDDLDGLLIAVNEVKPAHLAYEIIYKYLLIKDIHEVKTIAQMETLTIKQFAFGEE